MELGVPFLMYENDEVEFEAYQVIVDCILGTGFTGVPRDPIPAVINGINYARAAYGVFVISVDINSGMNGDTGEAETAVESDLTVSIGYYGFFQRKAPKLISNLANIDIGIELPQS